MRKKIATLLVLLLIVWMIAPAIVALAANLGASDLTVTIDKKQIIGGKKFNDITVKVNNGTKTYPSGGIAQPTAAQCGMVSSVTQLIVTDTTSKITSGISGNEIKWDKTNSKLMIYINCPDGTFNQMGTNGAAAYTTINTNQQLFRGQAQGW